MQVEIRPLQESDALISYQWRNNPVIWKYTGSRPNQTITKEIETEWIRNVLARPNEKRFAIVADGHYIGNTYLTEIHNDQAEFHIFIGEQDYWGKGIATLVLDKIIDFSKKIHLSKLTLEVHQDNLPAQRLYKKMGFVVIQKNNPMWQMEKIL